MRITIAEMAEILRLRKNNGRSTVLYLGTRAGGLFRNSILYDLIAKLGHTSLEGLNETEKFALCYRLLSNHERFTRSAFQDILISSLKTCLYRENDAYLVDLIREGLFEIIISSNIDTLLEEALLRQQMREPYDFRVLTPKNVYPDDIMHHKPRFCMLLKIYGSIESLSSNQAENMFYFEDNRGLKEILENFFAQDMLIVGFDPVWDQAMERVFPARGGDLWLVQEEQPDEFTLLHQVIKRRNGKCLIETQGEYHQFIRALHHQIFAHNTPYLAAPRTRIKGAQDQKQVTTQEPVEVFISYMENDEPFARQLETHLSALRREGLIRSWYSRHIQPGQVKEEEITQHINSARLILLLVSADFLASDHLYENELLRTLKRQEAGTARVIAIILRSVDVGATLLTQLLTLPRNGKPVNNWERVDDAWYHIIQEIRHVCLSLRERQ